VADRRKALAQKAFKRHFPSAVRGTPPPMFWLLPLLSSPRLLAGDGVAGWFRAKIESDQGPTCQNSLHIVTLVWKFVRSVPPILLRMPLSVLSSVVFWKG